MTREEVSAALNRAADEITVEADLPDQGVRDALNLMVNATLTYLDNPEGVPCPECEGTGLEIDTGNAVDSKPCGECDHGIAKADLRAVVRANYGDVSLPEILDWIAS